MILSLIWLLAQTNPGNPVPFPSRPAGTTVTDVGVNNGTQALENARNAGDLAASGLDRIWTELVTPDSPFYSGLIHGLAPLVVIGFLFWGGIWAFEMLHHGFSQMPLQKVLWPIIVILFLHGNGLLLASTTLVMKNLTYTLNNGILNSTIQGIVVKRAIQQIQFDAAYRNYLQQQYRACEGKTGKQKLECEDKALVAANKLAQQARGANSGIPQPGIWNRGGVVSYIKLAFEQWLIGILASISGLFHWGFSFCLAIWGLTGPLWLSITLLPIPTRGIYTFVSGFFGFSTMIVSFSLILGAVSVSLAQAANGDPLLFPLVAGLLSPFLAFVIGAGGALGMFVGLGRMATFVVAGGR